MRARIWNRAALAGGLARVLASLLLCLGLPALPVGSPAKADPATWKQEGWSKTDFSKSRIGWQEILSGGPPKDGIPSIDKPAFKPAAEDRELAATDPVIGLDIKGDARAYPLRVLIWHEIVNDVVGGMPITVTYCPLCNSAVVFDRRVPPHVLDFGTTGKLRNSDLVMYDRQTESWWQQFTGEAIVGTLAGTELKLIPACLESALGDVELAWQPEQGTALDHWDIAQGRDVGSVIATMKGRDGQRRDVPYDVTFAFAVFAFHPEIVIVKD
jgi:hypothetical protein